MQDNALIHKVKKTKRWFEDHGITPIFWSRYSPDLNPIEQLCFELKERVHKNNSELKTMGTTEAARQAMILAISRAWSEIPEKRIEELVKSMETRINAVIEAEGWYTRF
jgi:transposase